MRMRLRAWAVAVAGLALLGASLTGCGGGGSSLPTSVPTITAPPTPTPIEGLPDDHTIGAVNGHVEAGKWAFISTPGAATVGVRINQLWSGDPGDLADRSFSQPPSQTPVDIGQAVPYYLSWSYVILDGSAAGKPEAIVLPTDTGNLFNVDSVFSDHDCPDYAPLVSEDVGFLVTHCAVSLSPDGAFPIGLAFAVPDQTKQYWFLDAPTPLPKADETPAPPTPTSTPTG